MKLILNIVAGIVLGVAILFIELLYKQGVFHMLWWLARLWCLEHVHKVFNGVAERAKAAIERIMKEVPEKFKNRQQ